MRPQSPGRAKTSAEKKRPRKLRPTSRPPATTASPWPSPSRARELLSQRLAQAPFGSALSRFIRPLCIVFHPPRRASRHGGLAIRPQQPQPRGETQEPPYPPSYDEEGERNALRLLAESAYINLPSGQPLRLPVTVRQRAARRTPALIYQDDNESWRCGAPCVGCAKCHPRCLALSVCGTLIPEGEWRHAGKHQCSRCHARDRAGVPPNVPAPAI